MVVRERERVAERDVPRLGRERDLGRVGDLEQVRGTAQQVGSALVREGAGRREQRQRCDCSRGAQSEIGASWVPPGWTPGVPADPPADRVNPP